MLERSEGIERIESQKHTITIVSTTKKKNLKKAIAQIKKKVKNDEISYTRNDKGEIETFSYKDHRISCASDKLEKFQVVILNGNTNCAIWDKQ